MKNLSVLDIVAIDRDSQLGQLAKKDLSDACFMIDFAIDPDAYGAECRAEVDPCGVSEEDLVALRQRMAHFEMVHAFGPVSERPKD